MDPILKIKTDKYIRSAGLSIEGVDPKCLLDIIRIQAQRISDLEDHMEFVLNKVEKVNDEIRRYQKQKVQMILIMIKEVLE